MENKQIRITSIRKSDKKKKKSVSTALCKLHKLKDTISVFYKEKLDDNTFVNTKINAKKDEVEIIRTGEYAVRMVYKKGMETEFSYNTPYGIMPAKIKTDNIKMVFLGESIQISMNYHMSFFGVESDNDIKIDIF